MNLFQGAFFISPHVRKLPRFLFPQYNECKQRGRSGFAMSNSLAKVHPELVSEWSERNFPLTPDNITSAQTREFGGKAVAVTNGRRA